MSPVAADEGSGGVFTSILDCFKNNVVPDIKKETYKFHKICLVGIFIITCQK